MASSTLNRKAMNSSHHSSYSSTSASNLDNNLDPLIRSVMNVAQKTDALLDDLQTSISPSKNDTLPRSHHYQQQQQQQQQHKQQQYQTSSRTLDRSNSLSRKSPMRSASPAMRSMSPSQSSGGGRTRTIEKYVSTGPAGTPSGIPGLEMLDEELKDVQPGQSKTVAYKQVSYHYDKQQEGQNLESWSKSDKQFSRNDASIADDFSQRTFERSSSRSRDSPDFARNQHQQQHQNKEIIYKADVSTKTIPAPLHRTASESRSERDFKYLKETSARSEPSPALSRKNLQKSEQHATSEELRNVEYLPANLAPGPNTKVTTTIKTYTYELPGAPENYLPPSSTTTSVTKNVNVDKAVSYTVPKSQEQSQTSEKAVRYHVEEQRYLPPAAVPQQSNSSSERSVKYQVEEQRYVAPVASPQISNNSEKAMRYQQVEEQRFVSPPVVSSQQSSSKEQKITKSYHVEEQRYVPPPSQHSTSSEKAVRYHVEEQRYVPPSTPVMQHSSSNASERRYHLEEQTSPRYVAASPTPVSKSSHHEEKMFVERRGYRQASPQPLSQQSTLNRSERYVQQSRDYPDHVSNQRQERVVYSSERATSPVQSSLHNSSKQHFEEQHYSTSSRPPKPAANYESSNNAHFYKYDEQIIGTRPFPTSERPASPRQQPPRRIEDLMASFDSEEMHHQQQQHHQEVVEKRETFHSKNGHITKEVEYIKHSPSNGTSTMRSSSKSVAGPPVYYPPGSAEFANKEEAMAKNGSEWTKEKAAYEHGSAENTKKKDKSKKKVVPVCLPLCCALPCVIM
uniref:Uncharacterized protein n=1 Tax=Trichogramma kaykai TaxID=54128 RepID=A0ABD2WUW1_9HYME